jgi:hypothetical protein
MARSHHREKGSKDAPESQEVKLSGLTQPLPALSLAPKRAASLSSSHVLSASAPIANTRASGCAGLRVSETSSINTLPSAVSPPMLKPQTAGSHLFRRIASMSAKISVAPTRRRSRFLPKPRGQVLDTSPRRIGGPSQRCLQPYSSGGPPRRGGRGRCYGCPRRAPGRSGRAGLRWLRAGR